MNEVSPAPPERHTDPGFDPESGVPAYVSWSPAPPRQKFQHRYVRHLVLFALTFVTTTWVWSFGFLWATLGTDISPLTAFTWQTFVAGLSYSIPLLTILSAHEFGHYFACGYYNVDATLPYYLPAPLPPAGTFGAVIRIREPFPSKRALFDIGIAGPIAGFVVLIPFLFWGLSLSTVDVVPTEGGSIYFGEPLLWKALERVFFGVIPEGQDVWLHPIGLAAWWGMLATALNLLPFGQLDGGHIVYAAFGRRAARISVATLAAVLAMTLVSPSWVLLAVLLAVVSVTFGFRHPPVIDEPVPLDRTRLGLTVLALVILVLCFMPEPISIRE